MPEPIRLDLDDSQVARAVFGHRDEYLRLLADELTVDIHSRGTRLTIIGDPIDSDVASRVVRQLYALASRGRPVLGADVVRAAQILRGGEESIDDIFLDTIVTGADGRSITPKTRGQKRYIDEIRRHDIVFGVGPAGTGKTYLAMAAAVAALLDRRVKRIVLTRPAVEAGERLGFLPGDVQAKVNPYLRPLYDALHDMLDFERASQLVERGTIEVAPLAFMRGRTLNDSFVILDEAQNSTREQMKMFLTRLGFESKAVITGDITQIDLGTKGNSGLSHALEILRGISGIKLCRFTEVDVIRHPLVRRIIRAYEQATEEDQQTLALLDGGEDDCGHRSGER